MNLPLGLYVQGNRLFLTDGNNARLLVYNSVPTSNGTRPDMVIGKPDFVSNGSGQFISNVNFSGLQGPWLYNNKLFLASSGSSSVIILTDTTITPFINLASAPSLIDGLGRYRLSGSITMNTNNSTYWLQNFQADVNGTSYSSATFSSGRNDGSGNSIYDFNYDFDPTVGIGNINNLTIKFLATTSNTDTNTLFYFLPFKFSSFNVSNTKSQNFTFSVNKDQLQRVKDNLDHFEVWYKPNTTTGKWQTYISNISKSQIDNNGTVVTTKTNGISFIGSYVFKVVAIDNWGNRQDSNSLYIAGSTNPITLTSYPSFTKSFVTPLPSSTPVNQVFITPRPTVNPTVTPEVVSTDSINTNDINSTLKYYLFFGGSVIVLVGFLIFLLKRSRKQIKE